MTARPLLEPLGKILLPCKSGEIPPGTGVKRRRDRRILELHLGGSERVGNLKVASAADKLAAVTALHSQPDDNCPRQAMNLWPVN